MAVILLWGQGDISYIFPAWLKATKAKIKRLLQKKEQFSAKSYSILYKQIEILYGVFQKYGISLHNFSVIFIDILFNERSRNSYWIVVQNVC